MKIQISVPNIIQSIKRLKLFWIKSITENTAKEQRNILHKQSSIQGISPEERLQWLKQIKEKEEKEKKLHKK
jgi:hypothetical protein